MISDHNILFFKRFLDRKNLRKKSFSPIFDSIYLSNGALFHICASNQLCIWIFLFKARPNEITLITRMFRPINRRILKSVCLKSHKIINGWHNWAVNIFFTVFLAENVFLKTLSLLSKNLPDAYLEGLKTHRVSCESRYVRYTVYR